MAQLTTEFEERLILEALESSGQAVSLGELTEAFYAVEMASLEDTAQHFVREKGQQKRQDRHLLEPFPFLPRVKVDDC